VHDERFEPKDTARPIEEKAVALKATGVTGRDASKLITATPAPPRSQRS